MQTLDKICKIINLKRKSLEREIAALDSQIKSLDVQLAEIDNQKSQMTNELFAKSSSPDTVQDFRWLETWKGKLVFTIARLKEIKAGVIAAREPKLEELTRLIVRQDILNQKRHAEVKLRNDRADEEQTSERLETWVNRNIL